MPGPSPTADPSTDVLDVVRKMLAEVIGPEYALDMDIELYTSFDVDLELESLEFVTLAELLLERYGSRIDFVAWLATMELDQIIGLTVGDLVTFIESSVGGSTAPPTS